MMTSLFKRLSKFGMITITMLILVAWFSNKTKAASEPLSGKLSGVYQGFDDDGYFVFTDQKGQNHLFEEASVDLEYDLYNEDFIGEDFKLEWEYIQVDEYDDEGEPTGKLVKHRQITSLELN